MTRIVAIPVLLLLVLLSHVGAQQSGLTEAHTKSAEIETPQLVELLELRPGMTIADVGAGFGAWTMSLSRVLGPKGRVYATEVGAAQLAALREMVQREGLTNVTIVEGAANTTNLPEACCHAVLIRDVYHHLTHSMGIVQSVAASLKPGGKLAVVDFPPRPNTEVPPGVSADREGHGVPPAVVERELGSALRHVRTIPMWSPESQPPSLYLVLFQKR